MAVACSSSGCRDVAVVQRPEANVLKAQLPPFGSFLDVVSLALTTHAERDCLVMGPRRFTYAEVDALSARVANALIDAGFEPGMKGGVVSRNSPEAFIATLGIIRAGGVWMPAATTIPASALLTMWTALGCDVLFVDDAVLGAQLRDGLGPLIGVVDMGADGKGLAAWASEASATPPQIQRSGEDVISLPMTGGTTGLPKGVMLSHANFSAIAYAMSMDYQGREERPRLLCAAPMTHVGGRIVLMSLAAGVTSVIMPAVDVAEILNVIEKHRITDLFLPPTAIYRLLDSPNLSEYDLSSVRSLAYGSAPMALPRLKQALKVLGPVMRGGYGQTECPMFITVLPPEEHVLEDGSLAGDERLKSVGRASVISEVAIMNNDGTLLPTGEIGEIVVRGYNVSLGFVGMPEESAQMRAHGWHHTGDVGVMDEQGYLTIVDRLKDMIISGGFNVYSAQVETVLHRIEGVAHVAVVGIPDGDWGERVCAAVVPEPGAELDLSAITSACKAALGGVSTPKRMVIVDELPTTAIGKVDKRAVREMFTRVSQ
jgi:acyl-CoA synthetase (AMP-forming)/AMP-acid ligase II